MGEVVLVTGASAGIGLSCANRLHQRGWDVFGASRRGTSPGGWRPMTVDVDLDASVAAGFEQLLATEHRLDAVVACAGWGLAGAAELTPIERAKQQMETNFWGTVRVVQHALPVMRTQGRGRIILISSIGGLIGLPFQSFYSASKFAMEGYGEALAYEVAPFGIQVTLVEPGNVATEFTASRRMVHGSNHDDPYGRAAINAVRIMSEDEVNGVPPDAVALTVERVLRARRPPRRVSSGRLDERIGIAAKRLLPYRLFEKAAKGSLGV
jgi:NAD(P)-dependent dehydrogenase (short-subunit alcohol dehydrogenase family)